MKLAERAARPEIFFPKLSTIFEKNPQKRKVVDAIEG
jgi:hypothetical protein